MASVPKLSYQKSVFLHSVASSWTGAPFGSSVKYPSTRRKTLRMSRSLPTWGTLWQMDRQGKLFKNFRKEQEICLSHQMPAGALRSSPTHSPGSCSLHSWSSSHKGWHCEAMKHDYFDMFNTAAAEHTCVNSTSPPWASGRNLHVAVIASPFHSTQLCLNFLIWKQ